MIDRNKLITVIVLVIIMMLFGCKNVNTDVIYVDSDAAAKGDGKSWDNAYNILQDALDNAAIGDEIWVAAGTYKPTLKIGGSTDRHKSFQIKNGVALYGGFTTSETGRDERDWKKNETILSGDINGDDDGLNNNEENCHHVISGKQTDSSAVIDGFSIKGGNANFDVWPDDGGGGMNNDDGSPTVRNCTFKSNAAFADGGGMRNWGENSKPVIYNCTFTGNYASQEGGGMMNGPGSKPTVLNCKFLANNAGEDGGGMYNNESYYSLIANCIFKDNSADLTGGGMYNVNSSNPNVINCTFSGNSAKSAGGGISNKDGKPKVKNCILWDNSAPSDPEIHNEGRSSPLFWYCNVAGGYLGFDNMDEDPLFADDELRLSVESPCIDAGDNKAVPLQLTTDIDGGKRIVGAAVDLGAYEYK